MNVEAKNIILDDEERRLRTGMEEKSNRWLGQDRSAPRACCRDTRVLRGNVSSRTWKRALSQSSHVQAGRRSHSLTGFYDFTSLKD
jgi:hypothetical protein